MTAIESLEILKQNGFDVELAETAEDAHRPRLNLVAQPVSKSTVFDHRDLEELIHLIEDNPKGQMVRCSKARAMFAMRACRKSIMVGLPLTPKQMLPVSELLIRSLREVLTVREGYKTHGHHGSTMELSSRSPNHAPSFGYLTIW